MYRLKIDEGGERATPPALILATNPEHLELIWQAEDIQEYIAHLTGQLAVGEFVCEDERVGFGGIAAVNQISDEEAHLVLRLPPKEREHGEKHREIKEIAATIHVATRLLNLSYDDNHRRFPQPPPIRLTTEVSAESGNYRIHYMGARLAPVLIKNINGLSEEERSELKRQTEYGMKLFADHLLTGTGLSIIHANIDADGMIGIDCLDGSYGLSGSGRGNELVGHNVDTAAQQIMLIGGLAAIATYATTKQPK